MTDGIVKKMVGGVWKLVKKLVDGVWQLCATCCGDTQDCLPFCEYCGTPTVLDTISLGVEAWLEPIHWTFDKVACFGVRYKSGAIKYEYGGETYWGVSWGPIGVSGQPTKAAAEAAALAQQGNNTIGGWDWDGFNMCEATYINIVQPTVPGADAYLEFTLELEILKYPGVSRVASCATIAPSSCYKITMPLPGGGTKVYIVQAQVEYEPNKHCTFYKAIDGYYDHASLTIYSGSGCVDGSGCMGRAVVEIRDGSVGVDRTWDRALGTIEGSYKSITIAHPAPVGFLGGNTNLTDACADQITVEAVACPSECCSCLTVTVDGDARTLCIATGAPGAPRTWTDGTYSITDNEDGTFEALEGSTSIAVGAGSCPATASWSIVEGSGVETLEVACAD